MCRDLCVAIEQGDLERAKELLDNGSSVHETETNHMNQAWTPLQFAHYSVEMTRLLLDRGASLKPSGDDKTALHLAAEDGCVKVVRLYLDRGVDVDLENQHECKFQLGPPLYFASNRGHQAVANLLLDRGANVNSLRAYDGGPLHTACRKGDVAMAKLLLNRGADVNAGKDRSCGTALDWVCESGSVEIVRLLLERGAEMEDDILHNLRDPSGNDHLDLLRLLLDHGANLYGRFFNKTLLIWASMYNQVGTVQMLLDRGMAVDGCDGEEGDRPLHTACRNSALAVAELLVVLAGADVNAKDKHGLTPVLTALQRGTDGGIYSEIVGLLVRAGADVNAKDKDGLTPVVAALQRECGDGIYETVQLLLDAGAVVDATTREKNATALHCASWRLDCDEVVQMLVSRGANIEALDKDGSAPMHCACEGGCLESVQLFLDKGISVNLANGSGKTPFHLVCCTKYQFCSDYEIDHGNLEIAKLLCARGADVNAKDEDGNTPLHLICDMDYMYDEDDADQMKIVQLLLDKGADVEAKANNGLTPLHVACQRGNLPFVWLILRRYPFLFMDQPSPFDGGEREKKRPRISS